MDISANLSLLETLRVHQLKITKLNSYKLIGHTQGTVQTNTPNQTEHRNALSVFIGDARHFFSQLG